MSTENTKPRKCAACGAPAPDFAVNLSYLCDPHFDGWLARPRNLAVGGPVEMAAYVAETRSNARSQGVSP